MQCNCNETSSQFAVLQLITKFGEGINNGNANAARSIEVGQRMRTPSKIMGTVTQKQDIALVQRVCK